MILSPLSRVSSFFASATRAAALAAVATLATAALAPRVAHAEVSARVADIAAKGTIPRAVPVEAGLGLGAVASLLALGLQRRARQAG